MRISPLCSGPPPRQASLHIPAFRPPIWDPAVRLSCQTALSRPTWPRFYPAGHPSPRRSICWCSTPWGVCTWACSRAAIRSSSSSSVAISSPHTMILRPQPVQDHPSVFVLHRPGHIGLGHAEKDQDTPVRRRPPPGLAFPPALRSAALDTRFGTGGLPEL